MKTEYFVRSTIPVRVVFRNDNRIRGDRFDLALTVSSARLDQDGFVVDFERIQRVLRGIRDWLEGEPIAVSEREDITMGHLLEQIRSRATETLGNDIPLKRVELMGHEEGFALEMDTGH